MLKIKEFGLFKRAERHGRTTYVLVKRYPDNTVSRHTILANNDRPTHLIQRSLAKWSGVQRHMIKAKWHQVKRICAR